MKDKAEGHPRFNTSPLEAPRLQKQRLTSPAGRLPHNCCHNLRLRSRLRLRLTLGSRASVPFIAAHSLQFEAI